MKVKSENKPTDAELKAMIYEKKPAVGYKLDGEIITIVRPQNHWIQNFFRKLNFKIPENTYLELDEYGSFIFQQIDGKHSVYEIGQSLGRKFDEANDYLYSRLLLYLNHLENDERLIQRIN